MLTGIQVERVVYGPERMGYRFYQAEGFQIKELTVEEIEILDTVVAELGHLNAQEIIDKMHDEDAYKCTDRNCIIPFSYAEKLSID